MRLITHGCSFTFGQELDNPITQSWPAHVANKLNCTLVNLAKLGYANDGIVNDLVGFNFDPANDIVVVMWTWHHRLLFVDDHGYYTCFPEIGEDLYPHREKISNMLMKTTNQDWLLNRWLIHVILLQEFLKSQKVRYLFVNAFDNIEIGNVNQTLINKIDKKVFLGFDTFNFNELADMHYGFCQMGHPNANAHIAVSNIIFEKLKEII
jgi:hypothetical protein